MGKDIKDIINGKNIKDIINGKDIPIISVTTGCITIASNAFPWERERKREREKIRERIRERIITINREIIKLMYRHIENGLGVTT